MPGAVELGRACALRAATAGATVLIIEEDEARVREVTQEAPRVREVTQEATAQGATAVGVAMRLDDLEGLRELPSHLPEGTHRVDTFVNC